MSGKSVHHPGKVPQASHRTHPSPAASAAAPSYARALWRTTSADVSPGNAAELFSDGAETFEAMLALIDAAQRTVELESYILRDDTVGERFADSLGRAAERGVAVRVLGDWIGMRGTSRAFLNRMRRRGVEVRVFNTLGFRPWFGIIPRDHRKLLVVDAISAITGGIGIGDEWQGGVLRRRRMGWRDRCVQLDGPAAVDLERTFDRMWRRAAGERSTPAERALRRLPRNPDIDLATAAPAVVAVVEGEPGRMRIGRALHLLSAAATQSIWLASAYFIPSFAEVDSLNGAARDGVDVRLLLPSRNDHPWVNRFTRGFYKSLLRNGVRIWEWRGEMMHAKTSVVDGRLTRVGSTDFNPLGVAINYELDVYIQDPAVSARASELFLNDLDQSREIKGAPRG